MNRSQCSGQVHGRAYRNGRQEEQWAGTGAEGAGCQGQYRGRWGVHSGHGSQIKISRQ